MSIAFNFVGNGITSQQPDMPDVAGMPAGKGMDGFPVFSEILVSSLDSPMATTAEFDIESKKSAEAFADWKNLPPDAAVIAANFAVLANVNTNLSRSLASLPDADAASQSVQAALTAPVLQAAAFSHQEAASSRQAADSRVADAAPVPRLQDESPGGAAAAAVADDARELQSGFAPGAATVANAVDAPASGALPRPVAFTSDVVAVREARAAAEAGRVGEVRAGALQAERASQAFTTSAATSGAPVADAADLTGSVSSRPERDAGASAQTGTPAHREMRHAARQAAAELQAPVTAADAAVPVERLEVPGLAEMDSRLPVELEPRTGTRSEGASAAGARAGGELSAAFAGLLNAREAAPQPAPAEAAPSSSALRTAPPMTMDVEVLRLAANGGGRAVMELNPESPGSMRIDLTLDGMGQARLIVEAPADASRARLEQDVQRLQSDFASLGLTLSVDVRDQREAPRHGMQEQQPGGFAASEDARGNAIDVTPAALAAQAAAAGRVHIYA